MQLDDPGEKLADWLYLGCDLQPGMIMFECNSPAIWRCNRKDSKVGNPMTDPWLPRLYLPAPSFRAAN